MSARVEKIRARWRALANALEGSDASGYRGWSHDDTGVLLAEIDRLRERVRGSLEEHWCAVCERGGPYQVAEMLGEPMPSEGETR